jgi:hypothetical protein
LPGYSFFPTIAQAVVDCCKRPITSNSKVVTIGFSRGAMQALGLANCLAHHSPYWQQANLAEDLISFHSHFASVAEAAAQLGSPGLNTEAELDERPGFPLLAAELGQDAAVSWASAVAQYGASVPLALVQAAWHLPQMHSAHGRIMKHFESVHGANTTQVDLAIIVDPVYGVPGCDNAGWRDKICWERKGATLADVPFNVLNCHSVISLDEKTNIFSGIVLRKAAGHFPESQPLNGSLTQTFMPGSHFDCERFPCDR